MKEMENLVLDSLAILSTFKLQPQDLQVDAHWQGDTNALKTSEGASPLFQAQTYKFSQLPF